MDEATQIDEIDIKILRALIRDARESHRAIAKECGISPAAIAKRIERLKETGIITGAKLLTKEEGYPIIATIVAKADHVQIPEIIKSIREQPHSTGCIQIIGQYDIIAGLFAKDLIELDKAVQFVKNLSGVNRVFINEWIGKTEFPLENILPQPKEFNIHEKN